MTFNISYTITAPAKINLNLKIVRKRDDHYHDLESLVCFADLCDTLRLEMADQDTLIVDGEFATSVPKDGKNIVLKALHELRSASKTLPHFKIHLQKNIPAGAGLGGGSADAGAIIRFAREYFGDLFANFDWIAFARKIGADVPVCVESKPCIMRGIGEQIELLPDFTPRRGVLIFPNIQISTAPVFNAWSGKSIIQTTDPKTKFENANDLFAPAAQLHPELQDIAQKLGKTVNTGWGMSGSGSCFYALAENAIAQQKLLQDVQNLFKDYWIKPISIAA